MGLSDQGTTVRGLSGQSMLDDERAAVLLIERPSTDGAAGLSRRVLADEQDAELRCEVAVG